MIIVILQVQGKITKSRAGFDPNQYNCDTSHFSEDFIGKGSFGAVFKARLIDPSKATKVQPTEVAMKVIRLSDDAAEKKDQLGEIKFFSHLVEQGILDHKNIINYLAFVDFDLTKSHCVYMELCDKTLGNVLKEFQEEVADDRRDFIKHVTLGICRGVNHLHQKSIIHRDIAPDNILLKYDHGDAALPTVKVADFNVYTIHDKERREKQYHTANVGQHYYRAKEVRKLMSGRFKAIYGCSADIWSIGAVVYEMETKEKFMDLSDLDLLAEDLFNTDLKLRQRIKDSQLKSFLERCLQWNPEERRGCVDLLKHEFLTFAIEKDPQDLSDCSVIKISKVEPKRDE